MGSFLSLLGPVLGFLVVPQAAQHPTQSDPPPKQQQLAGQQSLHSQTLQRSSQSPQFPQLSTHTASTSHPPGHTPQGRWTLSVTSDCATMKDPGGKFRSLADFYQFAPENEKKALKSTISQHLMRLILNGVKLPRNETNKYLEMFSDIYLIHQRDTYLWRGVAWTEGFVNQRIEWNLIGEAIDWGSIQIPRKHYLPFTLIHDKVMSSKTLQVVTIISSEKFAPHHVLRWAHSGPKKVFVEGPGPCILSKKENPRDEEDTMPLHRISVFTGSSFLLEDGIIITVPDIAFRPSSIHRDVLRSSNQGIPTNQTGDRRATRQASPKTDCCCQHIGRASGVLVEALQ